MKDLFDSIYGEYHYIFSYKVSVGEEKNDMIFLEPAIKTNEIYKTGEGNDVIIIVQDDINEGRIDRVNDFDPKKDLIDLSYYGKDLNYNDIKIEQIEDDCIITFPVDNQKLVLSNLDYSEITQANFKFSIENEPKFTFIFGDNNVNEVVGDERNNIIIPADNNNSLRGGEGSDIFLLHSPWNYGLVTIEDFNVKEDFFITGESYGSKTNEEYFNHGNLYWYDLKDDGAGGCILYSDTVSFHLPGVDPYSISKDNFIGISDRDYNIMIRDITYMNVDDLIW